MAILKFYLSVEMLQVILWFYPDIIKWELDATAQDEGNSSFPRIRSCHGCCTFQNFDNTRQTGLARQVLERKFSPIASAVCEFLW